MATVFTAIGTAISGLFAGGAAAGTTAAATAAAASGATMTAGTVAAGTTAASTGATAGALGAASSAGLGMGSVLSAVSGALSIGMALSSINQGKAAESRLMAESAGAMAAAEQEEAAGAARARDLSREYAELTGEQAVVQLANGLDIGVGTPVSVRQSTKRLNEQNLDVTRRTASNRAAMQRLRSRGLMSEAKASLAGGYGRAAGVAVDAIQLLG